MTCSPWPRPCTRCSDGKPPRWPDEGTPSLPEIFELQRKPVERLPDVNPQLMDVLLARWPTTPTSGPSAAEFRDQLKAIDFADGAERATAGGAAAPRRARRVAADCPCSSD